MIKEYPHLYLGSISEAKRFGELDRWRESYKENAACKKAIEEAVRQGFDGMYLDHDCVRGVVEAYGYKRVGWVLANTLQQKQDDGRFSFQNREWAASIFIPRSDHNSDLVVESHPAVLDGFVNEFCNALDELQLLGRSHCESMKDQDLEGKVLVMSPQTLKESYWAQENQLWLATGGFGCSPTASGRAVYATCLGDGENARWERSDFVGVIKEEHLPGWAREQLEKLMSGQEIGPVTPGPEQVMHQ